MPSALREHQHELIGPDDVTGFVFGTEDTGYLTLSRPVIVGSEFRTNDNDLPYEDGRSFGTDLIGGKAVQFEIGVLTDRANTFINPTDPHRTNADYLEAFEGEWMDDRWRANPRAVAMLRTHEAGQTWRCYGRPSRYEEAAGTLTALGYTPIVTEFRLVDDKWYSDYESALDVSLVASPDGGLVAPLVEPLRTTYATTTRSLVVVGGTRPTWPVVDFHGPVTDPEVTIGGIVVGLNGYIAGDAVVTVDTRPWARSVIRDIDNAGLAGWLSRRTPKLSQCRLRPGAHEVSYRGLSETGTSRVTIRWRDARKRP